MAEFVKTSLYTKSAELQTTSDELYCIQSAQNNYYSVGPPFSFQYRLHTVTDMAEFVKTIDIENYDELSI